MFPSILQYFLLSFLPLFVCFSSFLSLFLLLIFKSYLLLLSICFLQSSNIFFSLFSLPLFVCSSSFLSLFLSFNFQIVFIAFKYLFLQYINMQREKIYLDQDLNPGPLYFCARVLTTTASKSHLLASRRKNSQRSEGQVPTQARMFIFKY